MTELVRNDLCDLIPQASDAHAGLLMQRGWSNYIAANAENQGENGKTKHIHNICEITASSLYQHAYERWLATTRIPTRFARCAMKIEGRLLIGLSSGGALETGCAVHHTYGTPYLPGSSIKGVVRAWALQNLKEPDALHYIFGCESDSQQADGLSGEIVFHDAWWIPDSGGNRHKKQPFAEEVVTVHHPDYYQSNGKIPATDLDSPIPNAMIGVRGSFLFTLECNAAHDNTCWLSLTTFMLKQALSNNGIGAKTAAGYGYLKEDSTATERLKKTAALMQPITERPFFKATLLLKINTGEITAHVLESNKITAPVKGEKAKALLANLPEDQRTGKKIKDGKLAVEVRIEEIGNMVQLLDMRAAQDAAPKHTR